MLRCSIVSCNSSFLTLCCTAATSSSSSSRWINYVNIFTHFWILNTAGALLCLWNAQLQQLCNANQLKLRLKQIRKPRSKKQIFNLFIIVTYKTKTKTKTYIIFKYLCVCVYILNREKKAKKVKLKLVKCECYAKLFNYCQDFEKKKTKFWNRLMNYRSTILLIFNTMDNCL